MATTQTTFRDPKTGETVSISAGAKLPTNLTDKDIDKTLAEASKAIGSEKGNLSCQGKAIVNDAQALIETTRKNELFQKLFAFARKVEGQVEGVKTETQGVPSDELVAAGRTLMDRVTGMASSLQTDAEDVASYIRANLYNFLTSGDYRDLASEFYTILKSLAEEIEEELDEEFDVKPTQKQKKKANRPWNQPLNFPTEENQNQPRQQQGQKGPKKVGKPIAERTEEMKEKAKELEEKSIEEIQCRLNDFLSRLAEKPEYQSLVKNFFKYSEEVNDLLIDTTEDAKKTPEAKAARQLLDQSYEILADFAGKKAVEKYRKDLTELFNKFKDDKELKKWREDTRDYILESLKNPEVEDAENAVDKLKDLVREGRKVLQKYRTNIDTIYEDQVKIVKNIKNDPTLQEFERNLTNLGSHLALNSKGEVDPAVMQESLIQITNLMAGLFRNYLMTLPISKVEIHSNEYDIVLQDIKVKGNGFAPDQIEINTKSHTTLNFVDGNPNKSVFQISFRVANICPSFEDFKYTFHKKSFPTYEDAGRCTIHTDDSGLSVRASMLIRSEGLKAPKAVLQDLRVSLGFLSIQTTGESNHKVLTPMLAPLFAESVRQRIEALIYQSLRMTFDDGVVQVNDFFATNPVQKVTQQVAANIQSNLPALSSDQDKKAATQPQIEQKIRA